MYAQGWGRVVNLSSAHGLRASAYKAAYVTAKHGLEGLSKVVALEGAPHGVTSNCINPGYVRTPLVESQIADQAKTHGIPEDEVVEKVMLEGMAVKRLVEPGGGRRARPVPLRAGVRIGHRCLVRRSTAGGRRNEDGRAAWCPHASDRLDSATMASRTTANADGSADGTAMQPAPAAGQQTAPSRRSPSSDAPRPNGTSRCGSARTSTVAPRARPSSRRPGRDRPRPGLARRPRAACSTPSSGGPGALLATDLAYLTLFDAEAGDTFMRATDGSVSAEFQSVRLALGDGLGGLVASTRKPYWTADYFADDRFQHTVGSSTHAVGDEGIVAICGTPLIVVDDFVGVLFAANRSSRPFTRDEVALLSSLATLAAVSLVQVRAMAETETALAALSEAHETVRRHTAGVERAAAAHDRFADLVLGGGGADDITKALRRPARRLGRACRRRRRAAKRGGYGARRRRRPHGPRSARRRPAAAAAIGSGRLTRHGDRYAVGHRGRSRGPGPVRARRARRSPPTTPTCEPSSGPPWSPRWSCCSSGRPPTPSSRCAPTSLRTSSPVEGTAPS